MACFRRSPAAFEPSRLYTTQSSQDVREWGKGETRSTRRGGGDDHTHSKLLASTTDPEMAMFSSPRLTVWCLVRAGATVK